MSTHPTCASCGGSGEAASENGSFDCPDCGGTGHLPTRATLVDWRARDIDKAAGKGVEVSADDARWLVAELRTARATLTEVIALAHDIDDSNAIAQRIRFVANRALGLYDVETAASRSAASAASAKPS